MDLNLPQSLLFQHTQGKGKAPMAMNQLLNNCVSSLHSSFQQLPTIHQLSGPKHRSLKGSQSDTQGFPLVFRELAVTALQLNTYHTPKQVLIAVGLGDTQTERDTSTCLGNNPGSRKLRPKRPTPETQPNEENWKVLLLVLGR